MRYLYLTLLALAGAGFIFPHSQIAYAKDPGGGGCSGGPPGSCLIEIIQDIPQAP